VRKEPAVRASPDLRTHAFLWIAVAYLSALGIGLIAGIAGMERHPIAVAWSADVAATLAIFVFSFAFGNSSFYDAYWSVAPVPIAVYWVFASDPAGSSAVPERQLLVGAVLLLWAVRLTANWARGWDGLEHEDWRYVDIRAKTGPLYWPVSLVALHGFPTAIVFLGLLPLWPALASGARPLGSLDVLAASLGVVAVLLEGVADEQLRRFRRSQPAPDAICASGLWAWSRHPNYLGEILFWVSLALFGLAAGGFVWWAWLGATAMLAMFWFVSIPLKETRMLARRPAYAERQRRVATLLPRPPRRT
jgi:steroid 5-alpha reductase family enzyme